MTGPSGDGEGSDEDPLTELQFFSSRYGVFIGFLYAVVVGQSFEDYDHILFDPITSPVAFLALISLYIFVIVSWAGYHHSISEYKYEKDLISVVRLGSDFLTMIFYVFMLRTIADIDGGKPITNYIIGFVLIFFAYMVNGIIRRRQHGSEASKLITLCKTTFYLILTLLLYIIITNWITGRHIVIDVLAVLSPITITILWRYWRDIGGIQRVSTEGFIYTVLTKLFKNSWPF